MANGHLEAFQYPLCRLWNEAGIVKRRENMRIATDTVMLDLVISAVVSGKKHVLNKKLKELAGGR